MLFVIGMVLALPLFFAAKNFLRWRKNPKLDLWSNVLLTRFPVVFIPGEQNLFYFGKYWNSGPRLLAEHGYEVYELNLPWRGQSRKNAILNWLREQKNQNKKFHLFCDTQTQDFLHSQKVQFAETIVSVQTPHVPHSLGESPDEIYSLLVQARTLAEQDFHLDL